MLHLITGVPGTGKTLYTISTLKDVKDRPIYYHNIENLSPDLGWIELKDPFNFHQEIPDGAIVVIDEVQQVFRQRPPRNDVPKALQFIETHRHHGVDIYFLTQRPKFLDHHARGLAGQHIHFHRNFGMNFANQYSFERYTDTEDRRELRTGQKTKFTYPKSSFGLYKSAEFHTVKKRVPKKAYLFAFLPVLFVFVAFYAYSFFDDMGTQNVTKVSSQEPSSGLISSKSKKVDWSYLLTPDVEGLPFTAPLFEAENRVKSVPMVKGCVSNADSSKCHCYTQQGTRIQMEIAQCLHFVKNTYFDFMRDDDNREVHLVYIDKKTGKTIDRRSNENNADRLTSEASN